MAKSTYGTGCFMIVNTGETASVSRNLLLTTIGYRINGKPTYAMEGSIFVAGATVQWLRDGLGMIQKASDIEALAASVESSNGVSFVPALSGLGAPHWKPHARGLLSGITGGTTKAHIARAVLEGVALQIVDILDAMSRDAGQSLKVLKVDGGMARNNLMMQLQSDLLDVACSRPTVLETTALGAAFLAGLGAGIWQDTDAIRDAWKEQKYFSPQIDPQQRAQSISVWHTVISKA